MKSIITQKYVQSSGTTGAAETRFSSAATVDVGSPLLENVGERNVSLDACCFVCAAAGIVSKDIPSSKKTVVDVLCVTPGRARQVRRRCCRRRRRRCRSRHHPLNADFFTPSCADKE